MNRQDVLDRALETLDAYGFADLSMRRLASSLGVQPGALYWHFANKQTLLMAVAEVILRPVTTAAAAPEPRPGSEPTSVPGGSPPPDDAPGPDWTATVRAWARTLREALLAHRDGAEVVASVLALRPRGLDPAGPCAATLVAAGLPTPDARAAADALVHYTVGHTVDAQTHDQALALGVRELTDARHDPASTAEGFEFGLAVFLDGLASRLPGG